MGSNVSIRVDPGYKTGFVTDLRAIQGLRPKSLDQSSPVLDEPEEQANQHRREAAEMLTKAISPTSVPASNGDLIEAAPRALPVPPAPMPAATRKKPRLSMPGDADSCCALTRASHLSLRLPFCRTGRLSAIRPCAAP